MTDIDQKLEEMQKQMESMRQENRVRKLVEMQKQMESIREENHVGMESIREESRVKMESIWQENRVGMELIQQESRVGLQSIWQEIRQLMSTIKIKTSDQPVQLQSEEGSGFVDAAPGVRSVEQHALQLIVGSELWENEEYIYPNSQYYGYFYGLPGLFRVKIPLSRDEDIKIEPVILNEKSDPLPHGFALFSHPGNHDIYIVGGQKGDWHEYSYSVYVFDPNRFHNLPINGLGLLGKPKKLQGSFKPMMHPYLIQSEDRIYLISVRDYFSHNGAPFNFQSFDLTKKCFETLTSPPYQEGQGTVMGFFSLCGYIYLFIRKDILSEDHFAYIYNTRLSQWEEHILDRFDELDIPLPSSCVGDVGLSDPICGKFRIMVILNAEGPAAYCIQLCDNGSLRPYSYRCLDEIFIHRKYKTNDDYAHLHDIGQGRFCVVYQSYDVPLLIYAFKIDFEVEHQIQTYGIKKSNPFSSHVLYSKKCEDPIPLWGMNFIHTLCLASTTSKGGMAATSSVRKDVEEKNRSLVNVRRKEKSSTSI